MNKFILATTVAVGIFGFGTMAYADQGIPVLLAQPLVAQTAQGMIGEGMPAFSGAATPIGSAQFTSNAIGESAPIFVNLTQNDDNGADYAQTGRPQRTFQHNRVTWGFISGEGRRVKVWAHPRSASRLASFAVDLARFSMIGELPQ